MSLVSAEPPTSATLDPGLRPGSLPGPLPGALGGWRHARRGVSLSEVHGTIRVPEGARAWRRLLAFAGPGLLVAVGYMDPGNWATDLAGGARYGYLLLTVILISNGMAMLLQHLALKLGLASGRDLAQACRDAYSRPTSLVLWVLAEIAIAATDLAEIIGAAIALNLLFGLPLPVGVVLTVLDVFVVLLLQKRGFRWIEAVVGGLIALIGAAFAYEIVVSSPVWLDVAGGLLPSPRVVTEPGALYVAVGILGATVMPHNLYLHSSIVQTRRVGPSEANTREAIRYATIDSSVALMLAFFVNAAILVLAAATFHGTPNQNVADIHDAYHLLTPTLGAPLASTLFAVALLAAGQNSTLTGTIAGQVVMEGFLDLRMKPWQRRLLTRLVAVIPAAWVAVAYGEKGTGELLVLSQVILSMQLSFAVVPLVAFTSSRAKMGAFANGPAVRISAWAVAAVIAGLNVYLLWETVAGWLA